MGDTRTLIVGVLVVVAFITITALIAAAAPYVAAAVVIFGLIWLTTRKSNTPQA